MLHPQSSFFPRLLPPGGSGAPHTSMALLVHLKTVSELRGKGDRIAKVTFRGREAPILWGPPALGRWDRAAKEGGIGKLLAGLGQKSFSRAAICPLPG